MTELAATAVAMQQLQTQSLLDLAFTKQNADFQRQALTALVETAQAVPAAPAGMGASVDQYA